MILLKSLLHYWLLIVVTRSRHVLKPYEDMVKFLSSTFQTFQ